MVDVNIQQESAEKIVPDITRMTIVAVDQPDLLSYCIFYFMRFLIIQE